MNKSDLMKIINSTMNIDLSIHRKEVDETYEALRDPRLAYYQENLRNNLYGMTEDQNIILDNIIKYIQLYNSNQVRIDVVKDRLAE